MTAEFLAVQINTNNSPTGQGDGETFICAIANEHNVHWLKLDLMQIVS